MHKVLIANRGEIAVRIIRACREMQISPVAVYSDATAPRYTCGMRTRPTRSGRAPLATATCASIAFSMSRSAAGADAVHPGYGFLAENEEFAAAVRDAGPDLHRPLA